MLWLKGGGRRKRKASGLKACVQPLLRTSFRLQNAPPPAHRVDQYLHTSRRGERGESRRARHPAHPSRPPRNPTKTDSSGTCQKRARVPKGGDEAKLRVEPPFLRLSGTLLQDFNSSSSGSLARNWVGRGGQARRAGGARDARKTAERQTEGERR